MLSGQIGVVTGASSGIGRSIAIDLGRKGAALWLVGRRQAALESVAKQAGELGGSGHAYRADLTRDEDIHELIASAKNILKKVDILVLCGGAISFGPTGSASVDDFDLQYRANLRCHYMLIQGLLPLLIASRGQIVFVNSSSSTRVASAGVGQFTATQYALRAIADSLRNEVNANGVRVLSVYPGRTATPRMAERFKQEGRSYRPDLLLQPEDVATMVTHALCLPRTAEVTDISIRPMMNWA